VAARVIKPAAKTETDSFKDEVREFAHLATEIKKLEAIRDRLKKSLSARVEAEGDEVDGGHLLIEFPEPIENLAGIKRERRVSKGLNKDAAEALIEARGLEDDLYTWIRVIDEDAVYRARFEDKLDDDDLDTMYPEKVTWAFVTVKA
jgi:hypothetical protein